MKKLSKFYISEFAVIIVIALVFTGCVVNERQKLIIGIDDGYPPIGFRNDIGEIVGFDIDLAKEIANRLDIEFEFKTIDWNAKEEELNSGNVDIIWNGLNITPERKEIYLFSKPYMENRQIILIKKGKNFDIHSEYDLAGKIVGVRAGSTSEAYVNRTEELKNTFADFKSYDSFKAAYDDLVGDKSDVLIIDELAGRYERSQHVDELEVINVTVGSVTEIGIGFRKKDTELRNKVQNAFDEMVKDGTAARISEKWFQADLIKHT